MGKTLVIRLSFLILTTFLFTSQAKCTPSELIDKVAVVAIKSINVKANILMLKVEIENNNDRTLKFANGRADFYLRTHKNKQAPFSKNEIIGSDDKIAFILKPSAKFRNDTGQKTNAVLFKIDLGKEKQEIIDKLTRMINAICNPLKENPIFYFDGKCYMGIKSDKGWTSARIIFNWVFRPELQDKIFLKESYDLPFPEKKEEFERVFATPVQSSKPLKWVEAAEPIKIGMKIQFKYDSDIIEGKRSFALLQEFGAALKGVILSGAAFTIAGHASSEGVRAYNQNLSERRAQAIKNYLIEQCHIASDRLNTIGYGEDRPIVSNATEAGRILNRRVEISRTK